MGVATFLMGLRAHASLIARLVAKKRKGGNRKTIGYRP
jgi:hypothetical protein